MVAVIAEPRLASVFVMLADLILHVAAGPVRVEYFEPQLAGIDRSIGHFHFPAPVLGGHGGFLGIPDHIEHRFHTVFLLIFNQNWGICSVKL